MKFDESLLYNIKSDYQGTRYSLFDLAVWKNGLAFKKTDFSDKGLPVIKIAELNNGISSNTSFTRGDYGKDAFVQWDDLLFSWSGNPQTSIDVFRYRLPDGWLNQHIFKVTANSELVTKDFLYYTLKYLKPYFTRIATNKQTTGLGHITIADLKRMSVVIPQKEIQEQCTSILKTIDDQIEINSNINDNLEQQAQALFKEWFIDNPDTALWRKGTFSDLIEKTISGDWGKDSPSGNSTEMVYCIRGADIPEVRAGNKGKMPTRYILPKNYASKQLVNGDIVVEISGGSPTQSTGRAAAISASLLARYDKGMVCTNFCKALKPRAGYSMYVYYYWQYLYDKGIFFSYENGTTGIKNLDINGFIETEPVTIAPMALIEKFNAFCQYVFSKTYANGMENEKLALIRDILLPKLMTGEVDVSEVSL